MQRPVNKIIRQIKNKIPELLVISGIFCVLVSLVYWRGRFVALSLDRRLLAQYQGQSLSRPSKPQHIFIKWFVDTDIETQIIDADHWTISNNLASYLDQSARPGEAGNIIIYGHNTRKILGNIRALKGGEEIIVTTEDGLQHHYKIVHLKQVAPTDTQYLEPTTKETLTIYTCSGFMDRQRFIVQAEPVATP